ncbi:DUF4214 domain-containing protein [Massilia pseudoviolaceinigra]|uniref:DUF4214 domain-containing protein n=1 Tax=Massilia pseudoviolaceinigra TaxID=3057165 RepID=UPI0027969445|nr:DUF4214 domain-containing protein [Massilia sp. CCM 9206]MDQ1924060.1 DUF4214 domain-containing protein [Massilia sp. CCM 9206]
MTIVSDIETVRLSGFNNIDALLSSGPGWNFLGTGARSLSYTFSVTSGNEASQTGQAAFSPAQQSATRTALAYITSLTGIGFTETTDGSRAQIHMASINIADADTMGLCSWMTSYTPPSYGTTVRDLTAKAYIYLDNVEFRAQNADLSLGGPGYEILLHELGHMLGLKHPFEGDEQLPYEDDHTGNTLMSYDWLDGPYQTYSPYDIAALNWLYGRDGLGGTYGVGSGKDYFTGRDIAERLTGTYNSEVIEGAGGDDDIDGGAGNDVAYYVGPRANYELTKIAAGYVVSDHAGDEGYDVLTNIETLRFSNGNVSLDYEAVVQALYVGYFGRAADYNGMLSFQNQLATLGAPRDMSALAAAYAKDAGLHALIDSFAGSAESAALYPGDTATFVKGIFQNVFGRAPASAGLSFWTDAIDHKGLSKANASLSIMSGALDNKTVQGILDAKLINNKLAVASGFTLSIDTAAEIAGYGTKAAAASVRTMLGAVTATTDLTAYQSTIKATLGAMTGAVRVAGDTPGDLPIAHADLIGIGFQAWEQTLV